MQGTKRIKDPGKQRKMLFNAPAHLRHKIMSARLSPELIKSRGAKTLPVRKGDTIRIMRGDHEGFEGKIQRVDLSDYRIYVEGLTREKVDGTAIFVSVHPSKVMIKTLGLDDKWRKEILKRKQKLPAKEEKVVKKAAKKVVEVKEEKPVEAKAEVQEKPAKKKPEVPKKTVEKKPAAKKQEEPKPKPAPVEAEKPVEKKAKAPVKKTPAPAKRKPTAKKEGGA
jgi:large subunit ribosomal protein L24